MERLNEENCDVEPYEDDYEIIECSMCFRQKSVEKGTWALENGMCASCYRAYQGG